MNTIYAILRSNTAPSILLILATLAAILCANIHALEGLYEAFIHTEVVLHIGAFHIDKDAHHWINDGLMALFFLVVGLEIKREVLDGHLSSLNHAMLPLIAAAGGVVAPALIYTAINWGDADMISGWAIPSATDIAFALGIIKMLGNRVPVGLKVCLAAIAIVDDLAAVIIIALFYTDHIAMGALGLAGVGLLFLLWLNTQNVKSLGPYLLVGVFIWACVLKSGVHATLAGVAVGLLIPYRIKKEKGGVGSVENTSPLLTLEHALHPWVVFLIVPIFAFANAGVSFAGLSLASLLHPITLGIALGLFLGKQGGVMAFSYVAYRLGVCQLPREASWGQYYGMALLTGIGFTMSLFIGTLSFNDPALLTPMRMGVLLGSTLSIILGVAVFLNIKKAHH